MEETKTKHDDGEVNQLKESLEIESRLEAISMMPKQSPQRYDAFLALMRNGQGVFDLCFSDKFVTILKRFEENVDESAFFRAIAASRLGEHYVICGPNDQAMFYQRSTIDHCKNATGKERKKKVVDESLGMVFVGQYLDGLRKVYAGRTQNPENPLPKLMQAGTREEFRLAYNMCQRIPTLTSDFLARVKALPQNQKTFLVIKITQTEMSDEIQKHIIAFDQKMGTETARNLFQKTTGPFYNKCFYQVLDVDWDRYHAGKKTRIFDEMHSLCCENDQSHQKNILATLAMACLEPDEEENAKGGCLPQRPKQVLLSSDGDASHPQIQAFMAMMGCMNIGTADPALLLLSKDDQAWKKRVLHLTDILDGISCGGCGLVGPKLQRCSCGKAYYCSEECQKKEWKEHKSEHKKALARKQAKKKDKTRG